MSRLFGFLAVAAIAFTCAPQPVRLAPARIPVELTELEECDVVEIEPERQPLGLDCGRLDLATDWPIVLELYYRASLEDAITADHIGPPPLPEPEEYRASEPKYPSAPSWRRNPKWRLFRANGGNAESERAVALGLMWLARQQKEDGSWEFDHGEKADRVAATGFVLLTYLTVGQTPVRTAEKDPIYRKSVAAGLHFLLTQCQPSGPRAGRFANTTMTGQAIATLALCEAYAATRDPLLKRFAQAAVNFLQKSQEPDGGWRDTSDTVSDIFVTGWVIQALDSARRADGLIVDDRVIKNAVKFLDSISAGSRKSMYGSFHRIDAMPGTTATAIGLLCRHSIDSWGPEHPGMIDGVTGLMKNLPAANCDPLYLHFATQVLYRSGCSDWKTWNEGPQAADDTRKGGVRDILVKSQNRNDGPTLGSWEPAGAFGSRYGRLGTTALNVLTLEVYYRDPAHKRSR